MKKLVSKTAGFLSEEDGQGMVEYGLILGLIAVAAIAALVALGPKISDIFTNAGNKIPATAS
ncbi:MAG: Flp family type IVb pilin [Bacillota bacterium]|nr:Flp family type IVb pilin [Bacillota bacterium]